MKTRIRRRKIQLTQSKKRKQCKQCKIRRIKSTIKRTRRFRKTARRFRKGKKQYGGKFNDDEIQQIRDILSDGKGFDEAEINDFIRRINLMSQDLSQMGEFQEMVVPQLDQNDKETIMAWLVFNEERTRNDESITDNDDSDIEV
jgi:hypothetical protein